MNKPQNLDRDRHIILTDKVGEKFALQMTHRLQSGSIAPMLDDNRKNKIVEVMNGLADFPFMASLQEGCVTIFYNNDNSECCLKVLSDGVTDFYKATIRAFREADIMPEQEQSFRTALTNVFQADLLAAYEAMGMSDGLHTGHVMRGC